MPLNFKKLSFGPDILELQQTQKLKKNNASKMSFNHERGKSDHLKADGPNTQAYFDMHALKEESNNSNLTPNFLSNTMGTNKITLLSVCSQSYNSGAVDPQRQPIVQRMELISEEENVKSDCTNEAADFVVFSEDVCFGKHKEMSIHSSNRRVKRHCPN